jgi:hypothetical protein
MSGVAEAILCGIVVEILKTCYVHGKKLVQVYRHAEEYKAKDAAAMENVVSKLLNIKDFYVEFWPHTPLRDRIVLGKCLKHIHSALSVVCIGNDASLMVGTETFTAMSATDIYQRLGEYGAAVDGMGFSSSGDSRSADGFWERVKKEVGKATDKMTYSFSGKDRHTKLIRMVGEWINEIDELIAFRSNQLILRGIIRSKPLMQLVQSRNLPNTSNRIELLLTGNFTPPESVERNPLNNAVTTFDRNAITITDSAALQTTDPASDPSSITSLGCGGNRHWATFSQRTPGLSAQKVIIEFRPITQFEHTVVDVEIRTKVLRDVRSLISALRIAARSQEKLHVLDCLGLFEVPNAIGIIFKLPFEDPTRLRCQTLNSILLNETADNVLSRKLSNRITLATSLAWTLSRFHVATWVHKSFSSDNILLFQDTTKISEPDNGYSWNSPFLVGFELARSSFAFSGPLIPQPLEWKYRAYTHPDRLRRDGSPHAFVRFKKRHDIYSFGVVMLELALLCPFTAPRFQNNPNPSKNLNKLPPTELLEFFRSMAQKLSRNMGSIYADMTLRCLEGNFEIAEADDDTNDTGLTERFIEDVCVRLQSIQV